MDKGESIGSLLVDLKINNSIEKDFKEIQKDVEKGANKLERNLSATVNKILAEWNTALKTFIAQRNKSLASYNRAQMILELNIDDVEEKARQINAIIENLYKYRPGNYKMILSVAMADLLRYEKEIAQQREQLTKDYYDRMTFIDDNYVNYRISQIEKEAKAFTKALGDKFDEAKFVASQMQKLVDQFSAFNPNKEKDLMDWADNYNRGKMKDDWSKPKDAFNPNGSDIWDEHNLGLLRTVPIPPKPPFPTWNREELCKDFIQSSRSGQEAFENFSDAIGNSLALIRIRFSENASDMEKIWGNMINGMIDKVTELIGKWAVLNVVGAIFGFGTVNLGSFLGLSDPPTGGGGKNLGGFQGLKLAAGGDFIVPQGFANDSYPMLVQSGERVKVTPSGKVGEEAQLLARLINAVEANTLDRRMIGNRPIVVQPKIQIGQRDLTKEVSKTNKTITREGWKQE